MRRGLLGVVVLTVLWLAPGALGAGVPASTFSAAGTASRPDLGPCALSVAGFKHVGGVAGRGSFVAAERAQTPNQSTCNGPPASLRFVVTTATIAGSSFTLTVTVTSSDDPAGAPVGTVGTIVATASVGGDSILFSIGTHSGGYSNGPGHAAGFIETWADVALDTPTDAARIVAFDGVGSATDTGGGFGPCAVAVAGTRVTNGDGTATSTGGGSFQAETGAPPPPENLQTATCNGGATSFGFAVADVLAAGGDAELGLLVSESADPGVPVMLPGTIGLYDSGPPAQKVNVSFGNHSGGFGPGRFLFHGFIDERPGVNVLEQALGTTGTPAPAAGGVLATAFSAAGTATRADAGPCALSVAGSWTDVSAGGRGSLVASGLPPAAAASSSCAGGPATLRFAVTAASRTGTATTLAVEVTQSDDAAGGTPVGSTGVITILDTPAGDEISFAIGSHTGSFTSAPGHATAPTATWADVSAASLAGVIDVTNFDGAATNLDGGGNFGPCTAAVSGTASRLTNGTTVVAGGGSYQARSGSLPVPPADSSTCSGGPASFGLAAGTATFGGAANAAVGFVVSDSVSGPVGGLVGGAAIYESGPPAQKLDVLVGNHIAGFGAGAFTIAGFSERRTAANVLARQVSAPDGGGGTGSTPGRVLGHGELQEVVSGTGGIPALTFSVAATATRPDIGPCGLSVAGWSTAAGTSGLGSLAAADEPRAPAQTTCIGPPASLRFAVRSVVASGNSVTIGVEVTQSDDPSTPVGTTGTIIASNAPSGASVLFGIGTHGGGFSMGPGHTGGFIDTWADVRLSTDPDALAIVAADGVGTSVDVIGTPDPCVVASAATRVLRAAGPLELRGGGSLQSDGSCNGGHARFAFTALGLVTDATANATVTAAVTETTTPTAPTGAGGTVSLQENAGLDKVAVAFGPHSGGWGPGRTLFNGFLDERPVTNVSSVDLRALPAAAPLFGTARKSPRVDLDNVRVRGATPDELKGRVKFEDRALGIRFKTSQVTSLVIAGDHVVVRGFATLEGPGTSSAPVAFRIDVDELGKKADLLSISLSNGYARSGAVVKGDFQLKPS